MAKTIYGNCSCGREYIKIEGDKTSFRKNGLRFIDPEDEKHIWNIFRCRDCQGVIEDTFQTV